MRVLDRALSALRPERTERLLVTSCMAQGDACRDAWVEFQRESRALTELFRTDRGELRRLGPMLHHNLRRNDAPVDSRLLTVLRTGFLREELRSRIYRTTLIQALSALNSAGVSVLVMGGASLGEWAYDDPALRHSHDIDLLVDDREIERARCALTEAGFAAEPSVEQTAPSVTRERTAVMNHRNGLPVVLHTSLYEPSCHSSSFDDLRSGARSIAIDGTPALVLSAADSLAHAIGQACFTPRRTTLQWACDAWAISASRVEIDPERFFRTLAKARLVLPAAVLLRYLSESGAPFPQALLGEATRRAKVTTALDRDLALHGLRRAIPGGFASVLRRMPDASTRAAMVFWTAFPTPAYVRWSHPLRNPALLPLWYVDRIGGAAMELAGARLHGRAPASPDDAP